MNSFFRWLKLVIKNSKIKSKRKQNFRRCVVEGLEVRTVLNGQAIFDDANSHQWIGEPWGDPNTVQWTEFDSRQALEVAVGEISNGWSLIRTNGFSSEDWEDVLEVRADIFLQGDSTTTDVKLETRSATFNPPVETITYDNLLPNQWNSVSWDLDTAGSAYEDISHLSIVFDQLSGDSPTYYVDNLRLVKSSGEELWDDMDDGSRDWFYFGNWYNWLPNAEFGHDLITHNGGNSSSGSVFLEWDHANGVDPSLNSAEVGTSKLDGISDWSGYNRISADVKISNADVPISVFLWDSDTQTGFGLPTKRVATPNTWETVTWDMPWPDGFDNQDIDEVKFVVNGINTNTTGTLYLDNIVLRNDSQPESQSGVVYDFAKFDSEGDITNFSSNFGELNGDAINAIVDYSTAANDSHASMRFEYDLPENSFAGMWMSLWGHSDYKATQSLDFTDLFGDFTSTKGIEQIAFWVRGTGLTDNVYNVKVELKDADDSFDKTAIRYFKIDDSITDWQKIVLDADVTNAEFWSYNVAAPDPTRMKFLNFVIESSFNDSVGSFYIDNIHFVDADDSPIDIANTSDAKFLELVGQRSFQYFLDWYEPTTGLFLDRSEFPDLISIASTGFGLTALVIGENQGWIDRSDAIAMITKTLTTLRDGQSQSDSSQDAASRNGYKGFYYHFLGLDGNRKDVGSELSSVDTALLIMGALTAKQHFSEVDEIVSLVDELYNRIEWDWMLDSSQNVNLFYQAWSPDFVAQKFEIAAPDGGFFSNFPDGRPLYWDYSTDEVMLINVLAIASPTHSVSNDVFYAWRREANTYGDQTLVTSFNGSYFTYVFAHLWIDFQQLGYDSPGEGGVMSVNWWENSLRATLANKQFVSDQSLNFTTYDQGGFLTAADGPDGNYHAYGGKPANKDATDQPIHDGTVAAYGAGSAVMFDQEGAVAALRNYYSHTELWNNRLGFGDAFNLDGLEPWYNHSLFGIDNGPMLIAIDNVLNNGFVQTLFTSNPNISDALSEIFPNADLGEIGETGSVRFVQSDRNSWHNVLLEGRYENPIVIAQPASYFGTNPTTIRIRNVTQGSFQIQLDEWDYLDGKHTEEVIGYVVMEAGTHVLEGGIKVHVGSASINHNFSTIELPDMFDSTPVVLSQSQTRNGGSAIVTRQKNVSENRFQVRLQEEQAADGRHSRETVGYIAIETAVAAYGTSKIEVGLTADEVTSSFHTINFENEFSESPIFLAGMQTFDGSDPATLRFDSLTQNQVRIFAEEEQSKDSEMGHTNEVVGFIALGGSGKLYRQSQEQIGESDFVEINQQGPGSWQTVSLLHSYENPVVIAQPVSSNDQEPAIVRVRNIQANSFEIQIDEWGYQDGVHGVEKVHYIVMESGIHSIDGATVEVGNTTANHGFKSVQFANRFESTPIVFSQSQTVNGGSAIVTRQQNVSDDQFQVRLQEEENADGTHSHETIGYIAISAGSGVTGGKLFEAGLTESVVSSSLHTIGFAHEYLAEPMFLASMQTFNGKDPAGLRYDELQSNQVRVFVEEEQSADSETGHGQEVVGYFAMRSGLIYKD